MYVVQLDVRQIATQVYFTRARMSVAAGGAHCNAAHIRLFLDLRMFVVVMKPLSDRNKPVAHIAGQGRPAFGSSDTNINYENWRPRTLLNGHQSNVVDLAWSPDATMLASASLDGHVIVWDAATGRSITTLAGHQGFVKGVAWDPFNHYLASQGEDGVLIWSVRDWNCVAHVKVSNGQSRQGKPIRAVKHPCHREYVVCMGQVRSGMRG